MRILASGLLFLVIFSLILTKNSSADVENHISATANSGGNTVSGGSIKTGNASAEVNAQNYVNGQSSQSNVQASAQAQGEGAQASVEVNGQKRSCTSENDAGCQTEINIGQSANSLNIYSKGATGPTSGIKAEKNIFQTLVQDFSNITESFWQKIKSWF